MTPGPDERSEQSEAERAFLEFLAVDATAETDFERYCSERPHLARELRSLREKWSDLQSLLGSVFEGNALQASLSRLLGPTEDRERETSDDEHDPSGTLSDLASFASGQHRYRIAPDAQLGQGGMGTIHRAWDKNLRRWVVRKVLDRGPDAATDAEDSTQREERNRLRALSRFLDEALVTGQLDHPGIVPVHELGVTSEGKAYFTMKMVEGEDLRHILESLAAGRYATSHEWTLNRVVGVLRRVCEAVAYAHSKGVLHRDVKPANIMVGRFGEAYIMDWGLARVGEEGAAAMDRATSGAASQLPDELAPVHGADSCLYTFDGELLGTPVYMSPEQANGDVADIDERSDIYSLGAILYQAITGQMPYVEPKERPLPFEVLMRVRRGAPRRVLDLVPEAPPGLREICERAMARDRQNRYQDMSAMAGALAEYLEDISEAREEARRQANRAELINRFLMTMLGSADPETARGRDLTVREVIETASDRLQATDESLDPLDEATMHETLGVLFGKLGVDKRSENHLRSAHERYGELLGQDHRRTLGLAADLAIALRRQDCHGEAEELLRQTLEKQRALVGVDDGHTLRTMDNLALVLEALGRFEEAERLYTDVYIARKALLGPDDESTLLTQCSLGNVKRQLGQAVEAEGLLRRAVQGMLRSLGEDHPKALIAMNNLASVCHELGRLDEAAQISRDVLRLKTKVLGEEHPETVRALNNLAMILKQAGESADAERLFRLALDVQERCDRGGSKLSLSFRSNLGLLLFETGRMREAEALFRQSLDTKGVVSDDDPTIARFRHHLGHLLLRTGRLADARAELERSQRGLRIGRDDDHPWVQESVALRAELDALEAAGTPPATRSATQNES